MNSQRTAWAVAVACACTAALPPEANAALSLADLEFWVGPAAGPNISQAVLVIDFAFAGAPPGAASLAWGYRWPSTESRTGHDLLAAVVAADPRLTATGLEFGFIDTLSYDVDLDGADDFVHPGFDPATGRFSMYWVNNAVIQGRPPLFADAGHVLPPNGNPYDGESPGTWVTSSTGLAGRPLADGSWDGWRYAAEGGSEPGLPSAAPVPEPGTLAFLFTAGIWWWRRRRPRGAPASRPIELPLNTSPWSLTRVPRSR